MDEKKYNEDGYLIVSESSKCPLWEKITDRCSSGWIEDCFFCKHSDFRKQEYIQQVERSGQKGVLYSVCHNEKNKQP